MPATWVPTAHMDPLSSCHRAAIPVSMVARPDGQGPTALMCTSHLTCKMLTGGNFLYETFS
eukprot:scaffold277178_cov27-Prasinocladus_malaysianus.AAC.1